MKFLPRGETIALSNTEGVSNNKSEVRHNGAPNNNTLIDVSTPEGQKRLAELLQALKNTESNMPSANKSEINTDNAIVKIDEKKKLASGRVTKPDESDIKKQVKFAHEKLDSKHVKEKLFDKLTFPTLIAGELELASLPHISEEERRSRVALAKTMCYHKLYLCDEDLRNGYDAILKTVEQGTQSWSEKLAENLNTHYEFRANVVWREKLATDKTKGQGVASEHHAHKDNKSDEQDDSENKIIYCMEFNKSTCAHNKSHNGKWKGKSVTKWHICRSCLRNKELAHHSEKDCKNKSK